MFQSDVLKQILYKYDEDSAVYAVVKEFAETMLEPIILRYSLYPAKGTTIPKFAHNADQMMMTHIFNGLFPTLTLIHEGQKRGWRRLRKLEKDEIKVYILTYAMHDIDKILGEDVKIKTLTTKDTNDAKDKVLEELELINARAFLPNVENWVGEILWLAVNTQRSRDINLSHNTFVAEKESAISEELVEVCHEQAQYPGKGNEPTLRDLCTYSDLIAFLIKSPEDVLLSNSATRSGGLSDLLSQLTDDSFVFSYHKLSEVRGLLSNQINNAAIRYIATLYPEEQKPIPYLYFPNGVVYLGLRTSLNPTVNYEDINQSVKETIGEAMAATINHGDGIGFNGKGLLSYPRYFLDFIDLNAFLDFFVEKTISESKANVSGNILQKMLGMQKSGMIPTNIVLDYTPDERITMLGRFLINYTRIIHENLDKSLETSKKELEQQLISFFGDDLWEQGENIPSSGGVDYRYYWIAARYLANHPPRPVHEVDDEIDSLEHMLKHFITTLLETVGKELKQSSKFQGSYFQSMLDYLCKNLLFGFTQSISVESLPNFYAELTSYQNAKKPRQNQLVCTICHSAYPTTKQEEASVLFQPWVYKNHLPLYKGESAGGICAICSLELMLRQTLLSDKPEERKRINLTGKDYEDMALKYFFIYPNYFFTRQTFHLVHYIIRKMKNLKLYEVCEVLRLNSDISTKHIVSLSFFNLSKKELRKIDQKAKAQKASSMERDEDEEEQEAKSNMFIVEQDTEVQQSYEESEYPGFLFFAKKTFSAKPKTKPVTASWVEATWLGLALPLITGSKVVVTESYLPLFNSSLDFHETLVLDTPHSSVRHLLPLAAERLRLDQLYGLRSQKGDSIGGVLEAFSRAIELHIDTERAGGDLKLERFTRIARDLETDQLFTFAFLKEQVRDHKMEFITGTKARHYNGIYQSLTYYYHPTEGAYMEKLMTRHEKITRLYLAFYNPSKPNKSGRPRETVPADTTNTVSSTSNATKVKSNWPKSHAIVRPIDIAAKSILKDTINLSDEEIQLEMFQALRSWVDIVRKGEATGKVFFKDYKDLDEKIWQFVRAFYQDVFCDYAEKQRSLLHSRLNRFKGGCEAVFTIITNKTDQAQPIPTLTNSPSTDEEDEDETESEDL